jgi:hypothetical protein
MKINFALSPCLPFSLSTQAQFQGKYFFTREVPMRKVLQKGAIGLALVTGGVLAGGALTSVELAHGEVRTTAPPQAFQSGGQLSVPVLKEISATLRQIDSRLARLESMAQKLQTAKPDTTGQN